MVSTPRPSGVARHLAPEELIVSKTDLRGHLTYVNDTFVTISGYAEADLLGKPHSTIRHPDMPRAVFSLLWETIAAGEEIFAYVVNLCADGAHYWVLAHVTPSVGGSGATVGYHSNRRAPAAAAVAQVEPLYRRLREVERRFPNAREAARAGRNELDTALAEAGCTYEQLVWSLVDGRAVA